VSVGGQIPNTLALKMAKGAINVAGTSPTMIDTAEDRNKFSALCDSVGIDQPKWRMLTSTQVTDVTDVTDVTEVTGMLTSMQVGRTPSPSRVTPTCVPNAGDSV
jgi:carbamoylphosphate synthase large subunit